MAGPVSHQLVHRRRETAVLFHHGSHQSNSNGVDLDVGRRQDVMDAGGTGDQSGFADDLPRAEGMAGRQTIAGT